MSEETKHSPEPWEWRDCWELRTLADRGEYRYGSLVLHRRDDSDEPFNVEKELREEADRRRVVACVNALAGIPTEALEKGVLAEVLKQAAAVDQALQGVRLPYENDGWQRLIDLRIALHALGRETQ